MMKTYVVTEDNGNTVVVHGTDKDDALRTYAESFGGVVREADGYEYDYEGAQSEEDLGTGNDDWLFNIDETINFEKYKARIDEAKANYTILQIIGFIHDLWYEDDIDEATEAALYDYIDPEEKYNNATEYDWEWESIINPLRCDWISNATDATEVCPHCESETTVKDWNPRKGYIYTCAGCGRKAFLCSECMYADDNPFHKCDWEEIERNGKKYSHCMRGEYEV